MTDYVDVTATFRVEAVDCKEAIELVEHALGAEDDSVAVDWPTIEKVTTQEYPHEHDR